MRTILLTFLLLLTFSANGMAGMSSAGDQMASMPAHSMQMSGMDMDEHSSAMSEECQNCMQQDCSMGSDCASCAAHCVTGLTSSSFALSTLTTSELNSHAVVRQFPSVHFLFLRPPQLI